jgi:hypothetical protein
MYEYMKNALKEITHEALNVKIKKITEQTG